MLNIPPRIHLANLPTRIDELRHLSKELGVRIFIKRDDETGSELTGNKVRKLEFVLPDALAQGCDTLITCGGIQSNHARAVTAAAVRLGLAATLVLKTDTPPPCPDGNYLMSKLLGATFRFISEQDYAERRDEIMEEVKNELAQKGVKAYIIPEGASNGLGCFGYYQCLHEIAGQERKGKTPFDTIVVPVGSGGTYAGLYMANKESNAGKRIVGFNVCSTAEAFRERITGEINEALQIGGGQLAFTKDDIDVVDGYVGLGYALSRQEELDFIAKVARTDGIIFDPVYTGKALYGLYNEIKKGTFSSSKNILFIHTGGVPGLYPKREAFTL
jgi:D-cysteine desulfhydrase